jgi:pSer/pThr/pTyr-binding forkhead associated (FHA) protein
MSENRTIVGHTCHSSQGPHLHMPAGFVPLRLHLETGELIELTCPVAVVGRHSEADLRIAHPEISRRHCQFTFADGVWRVRDLNSLNGVVLNNKPITEAMLCAGDRLRLGCVNIFIEKATPTAFLPILPADLRRAG